MPDSKNKFNPEACGDCSFNSVCGVRALYIDYVQNPNLRESENTTGTIGDMLEKYTVEPDETTSERALDTINAFTDDVDARKSSFIGLLEYIYSAKYNDLRGFEATEYRDERIRAISEYYKLTLSPTALGSVATQSAYIKSIPTVCDAIKRPSITS